MTHIPETYYIVCDYGKNGRESIINWEDCSKQAAILAITRGQCETPLEVHCIDRNDGTWRDVSEDIARDIAGDLREYPEGNLCDFLETHLGHEFMADMKREMAA